MLHVYFRTNTSWIQMRFHPFISVNNIRYYDTFRNIQFANEDTFIPLVHPLVQSVFFCYVITILMTGSGFAVRL